MSTITDYVASNHEPVNKNNFNEQDGLVMAELSYEAFEKIENYVKVNPTMTLKSFAIAMQKVETNPDKLALLKAIETSDRYKNCTISNMQSTPEERQNVEQWAGITVSLNDVGNTKIVGFRGTDGSRAGWKEDFELAYSGKTNAQEASKNYLTSTAANNPGSNIIVVGHSKGGNDAIYSYVASGYIVRAAVTKIYNYDGPGLAEETAKQFPAYAELDKKLQTYCPQDSIIGMLLKDHGNITYVTSTGISEQTNIKILGEHDAFNWLLDPASKSGFQETDQTSLSIVINSIIDGDVAMFSLEEREGLVSALDKLHLFEIIGSPKSIKNYSVSDFLDAYASLSPAQQETISTIVAASIFYLACDLELSRNPVDYKIDEYAFYLDRSIRDLIKKSGLTRGIPLKYRILLNTFVDAVIIKIDHVAKRWARYINAALHPGSFKSYSKDKIYVDYSRINECFTTLGKVQDKIKGLDGKLDSLYSELKFYELHDKATVAKTDYTMCGSNFVQNLAEHFGNEGYDWELAQCINYLDNVRKSLKQNEITMKSTFDQL